MVREAAEDGQQAGVARSLTSPPPSKASWRWSLTATTQLPHRKPPTTPDHGPPPTSRRPPGSTPARPAAPARVGIMSQVAKPLIRQRHVPVGLQKLSRDRHSRLGESNAGGGPQLGPPAFNAGRTRGSAHAPGVASSTGPLRAKPLLALAVTTVNTEAVLVRACNRVREIAPETRAADRFHAVSPRGWIGSVRQIRKRGSRRWERTCAVGSHARVRRDTSVALEVF